MSTGEGGGQGYPPHIYSTRSKFPKKNIPIKKEIVMGQNFDKMSLLEKNLDLIFGETWCQFNQHFMYNFFAQTSFRQLFLRTCS